MSEHSVTATLLNLRSNPSAQDGNIITRLKKGELVDVVDTSSADWYKINTINRIPTIGGYASSAFLVKSNGALNIQSGYLQPIHLPENTSSKRSHHGAWEFPLSEANMPRVVAASPMQESIKTMHEIVSYLAVNKSARYRRDEYTYCNIYACDYCFLSGVFLPRVWWMDKALLSLKQGIKVVPKYALTVHEMNANALYTWLEDWGDEYNWKRTYDLDDLQTKVNEGRAGIICGPNKNPRKSGHICCVIPERENHFAARRSGKVICPLLSQAGAVNLPYYNNHQWWHLPQIREFGFWYMS